MQRAFAGDIEISFERMVWDGMRRRIDRWKTVPIQIYSSDLNAFDIDQERIACQTIADPVMKERDNQKHGGNQRPESPCRGSAGKTAKRHSQQRTANEDYSSDVPVLPADLIENLGASLQPRDLLVELSQTSHGSVDDNRFGVGAQNVDENATRSFAH